MIDIGSEAAGLYAEEVWKKKYNDIDSVKESIIEIVDECISSHSEEGIAALNELYSDQGFVKRFESDKEMAYLYVALLILHEEKMHGEKCTILSGKQNIEELIAYIKEIKFRLWRIEFAGDTESVEWVNYNIENGYVSETCVNELIKRYCGNEPEKLSGFIGRLHG